MTAESRSRRRRLAAVLWLLLAFLTWNVRFDYGVRLAAKEYLAGRVTYLRGQGPRVEIAGVMRAGVASSAAAATQLAFPVLLVGISLAAFSRVTRTP